MNFFRFLSSLAVLVVLSVGMVSSAFAESSSGKVEEREFIELFPSDIRVPFTQETVTKLNAIVRRSYDAINEYDDVVDDVRVSVNKAASDEAVPGLKQRAEEKLGKIILLDKISKNALTDIMAAAQELRSSDEEFNNAILEGMIDFVKDVEREIRVERVTLDKALESA